MNGALYCMFLLLFLLSTGNICYSKTPKQVFFNVIKYFDSLTHRHKGVLICCQHNIDPSSGRRYSIDEDTGQSEWVVE